MNPFRTFFRISPAILAVLVAPFVGAAAPRPNVLLVMPDDLSFGDFSYYNAQGPRTPNIDRLARESVRLTDFHVSPTCSPTRAALMTGRYNDATGVWHTIKGRELLRADEVTMAEVFRANGFATALIGKWHLGDSYPLRPMDRGFDFTAAIRGGGIDQQPDYCGNTNRAPGTLFIYDRPFPFTDEHDGIPGGYSTNFFTDRAIEYMKARAARAEPFFLYLPYNVAHDPPDMPPDARSGISPHAATVENLDKNVGRLLDFLRSSHLEEGTILVFLTDNGMASALWRAGKSSEYEGGHRVPCFIRWKNGGMGGSEAASREVPQLTGHIDWLPTLMDLLHLHDVAHRSPQTPIQGRSVGAVLGLEPANNARDLWNRILVVDNQRTDHLSKYKQAAVMQDETDAHGHILHQWRLIPTATAACELYDVQNDPLQKTNLSERPELAGLVTALKGAYETWWSEVSARALEYSRVVLGTPAQPRVCLYSHDWHNDSSVGDAGVPWNQGMVAAALPENGFSAVEFSQAGKWRFELRRWPEEIGGETTLTSALRTPVVHGDHHKDQPSLGVALPIHTARIRIWDGEKVLADLRQEADPGRRQRGL